MDAVATDSAWAGWHLEPDGSVLAARTMAHAVVPAPESLLIRFDYLDSQVDPSTGGIKSLQLSLDHRQVGRLVRDLLDYRDPAQRDTSR